MAEPSAQPSSRPPSQPRDADDPPVVGVTPVEPHAFPADTFFTDEPAKLPPAWAGVPDAAKPLPPGVSFFEKRLAYFDLVKTTAIAVGLALFGVIVLPMGVYGLWDTRGALADHSTDWWLIGFGFVLLFAAWVCVASLGTRWRALRRQGRGEPTRLGLFIGPDAILESTETGLCLIPRACFRGLSGNTLNYTARGQPKFLRLPQRLVRDDPRAVSAAIERWALAS